MYGRKIQEIEKSSFKVPCPLKGLCHQAYISMHVKPYIYICIYVCVCVRMFNTWKVIVAKIQF